MTNEIYLYLKEKEFAKQTQALKNKLNVPILKTLPKNKSLILYYDQEKLNLKLIEEKNTSTIHVDFVFGKNNHRRKTGVGKKQAIARAVGMTSTEQPTILDATAGLGKDAFVLATLGSEITLIERSPIVAALLQDGLKRAAEEKEIAKIIKRMKLVEDDSIAHMKKIKTKPDVIYLDPMFPCRKKTALVKKEMRILNALLGSEENEKELLEASLKCAKKRVVVKRPRLAPSLANKKPNHSIIGKITRFDVYLVV